MYVFSSFHFRFACYCERIWKPLTHALRSWSVQLRWEWNANEMTDKIFSRNEHPNYGVWCAKCFPVRAVAVSKHFNSIESISLMVLSLGSSQVSDTNTLHKAKRRNATCSRNHRHSAQRLNRATERTKRAAGGERRDGRGRGGGWGSPRTEAKNWIAIVDWVRENGTFEAKLWQMSSHIKFIQP